jgi:hemerythrin-like metal-binding protein
MALIDWTETLCVGHSRIDEQHQELTRLVNALHEAMLAGRGKAVLGEVLDQLIAYTVHHFAEEEAMMAATKYPGAAAHLAQHEALKQRAVQLQAEFRDGGGGILTMEVLEFLKGWLRDHIVGSDKLLAQHLRSAAA